MKKPSNLSLERGRLEELLMDTDSESKEYYRILAHLEKLDDIERKRKKKFDVSGDTIVIAGVNLAGILMILHHERLHAVSSKAVGFITKLKF